MHSLSVDFRRLQHGNSALQKDAEDYPENLWPVGKGIFLSAPVLNLAGSCLWNS